MHKILATKIESQYNKEFQYNIKKYNTKNHTVAEIEKLFGKPYVKNKKFAKLELPKIKLEKEKAIIKVNKHTIWFTSQTLFEDHIYLNNKKIRISKVNLTEVKKAISDSSKVTVINILLDFLVDTAIANDEQDEFEVLIFSTIIAVGYDFDSSWCFLETCKQEKGRSNFEVVMREIKRQAVECETYGIPPTLIDDMSEFQYSYNLQQDLSVKLEDVFSEYSANELTCQRFVENFHQEEIKERTSRNERRGYLGGTFSDAAQSNAELNKNDFDAYVSQVCQPYVDLRNCMVRGHREAATLHDKERGPAKAGAWRQYTETYQPVDRTGATER